MAKQLVGYIKYAGTIEPSGRKIIRCEECDKVLGYICPNGSWYGIERGTAYEVTDDYVQLVGRRTKAEPGQTVLLCDDCQNMYCESE